MSSKPLRADDAPGDVNDEGYQRMLAIREFIRQQFFSPESMRNFDPDAPEIVGVGARTVRGARR